MVTEIKAEPRIIAKGFRFTESPHWYRDHLWFSDMHADKVFSIDETGRIGATIDVPGGPNGLGWMPDGRMLIVSTSKRLIYRVEHNRLALHADLSRLGEYAHPLNDMCVDLDGTCYVGEFGLEIHGWLRENLPKVQNNDMTILRHQSAAGAILFRVSPDGVVQEAASGLRFPNGATITDDNKLVVAESLGLCVSIFTIREGHLLDQRRIYCDFAPDGVSRPDAEGRIWVADPVGKSIALMSPEGDWPLRIHVPRPVYACAIRRDDPNRVYLCTSSSADPNSTIDLKDSCIEVIELDSDLLGRKLRRSKE
jgi:sugar lactone lactonase YvrE